MNHSLLNKKKMIERNKIFIREYNINDIELIANKQEELINFHLNIDKDFYKPADNAKEELKSFLERKQKDNNFKLLIAEYEGIAVGYVMGWVNERPPIYFHRREGYLSNIYIDKNYRGRGIGSALYKQLENWFVEKAVRYIEIKADCENLDTVKSFIALGFTLKIYSFMKKVND